MKTDAIQAYGRELYQAWCHAVAAAEKDEAILSAAIHDEHLPGESFYFRKRIEHPQQVDANFAAAQDKLRNQCEPLHAAAIAEAEKAGDADRRARLLAGISSSWVLVRDGIERLSAGGNLAQGVADVAPGIHAACVDIVRLADAIADTKTDTPKKTSRKMNANSGACATAFRKARRADETLELLPFVKDWAEQHGKSWSSIYKILLDNPDVLKTDA